MRYRMRAVLLAGLVGIGLTLLAGPASAHVTVEAELAQRGQPATLQFRAPSEEQVATTVRIDVALPPGVVVTGVDPVEGWTAEQSPDPSGVTHVTWTASDGSGIEPAAAESFFVQVGPLPDRPLLGFEVLQTYSNGSVVGWNQAMTGTEKPDFPAPVLSVAGASAGAEPAYASAQPVSAPAPEAAPAAGGGESAASVSATPIESGPGSAVVLYLAAGVVLVVCCVAVFLFGMRRRHNS